ncbi:MAG: 16S rRNA (uracil(1498)-N(3))-methyltransferase [Caldilineae bacterium]|nr:MAG: 16S rRNA (uracil(1498)-N(3))-methyltransferase [Caldilineae bacterium]
MHRFFVPPHAIAGRQVTFDAGQARQLLAVLRLRVGDQVVVLDNRGGCFRTELIVLNKRQAVGRILEVLEAPSEPAGELVLCQALTRNDRFEWILQKGVELGVTHFWPMLTRRTVARPPGSAKWERWQRILREAAEQCGRSRIPSLAEPRPYAELLGVAPGMRLLPTVVASRPVSLALEHPSWPVTLFIGPEGGFDPEEVEQARTAGVDLVSLGPRTLRSETAALALITLTVYALGELSQPGPRASGPPAPSPEP